MTEDLSELVITGDVELPEFEGLMPVGVITRLTGAGQRIGRPLHHGEHLTLVVDARVQDVQHPMTKDGLKRVHVLAVDDLYELEGKRGARLLAALKKAWRLFDDDRSGKTALGGLEGAGDGIEVTTDAAGVVLTDADLKDLGMADQSNDPAMIVFANQARALWPDDFGAKPPRCPDAGDRLLPPGSDPGADDQLVMEIVDPRTGETLDSWSDEAEEARLLEQEHAAELEEAQEDRAAMDQLTQARMMNRAPWPGFDSLTAAQAISHLTTQIEDVDVCEHVIVFEGRNKGRQTVIDTARRRAAVLRRRAEDASVAAGEEALAGVGEEE